jgi:hypothetical protein
MNVRTTKTPPPRIDTDYQSRYNITTYGADNLYPQHLQRITKASGTATLCLNRYAKFVEGWGFDERLSRMVVNDEGETADTLLHDVVGDLCEFGGFALHVNYNLLGEVSSVHHVPFEHCRLEEPDDVGVVAHIKVSDDWSGTKKHKGHTVSLEENIETFPVFNPDPVVVLRQIENVGGIDNYHGQIMWCSMDGGQTYPTPIYDAAVTEISTDEGLGNVKNRNVRNNFLVACMMVAKRGVPLVGADGREQDRQMIEDEDLRAFQGDENASKILYVELENDEDKPEIVEFPSRNFDKDFSVTDASVIERIYAQFHQELFYSIRLGKLGFSGDVMRDAYEYYAGEVTNEQRFISRYFAQVLARWHDEAYRNVSTEIEPLRYINSTSNNTEDAQ